MNFSLLFLAVLISFVASQSSTTPKNTCVDKRTDCASYKDLCKNANYQSLLSQGCSATCKYCTPACADTRTECANWKTLGFCTSSSYTLATKTAYCKQTCGLCGTLTTPLVSTTGTGSSPIPTGSTTPPPSTATTTAAGRK